MSQFENQEDDPLLPHLSIHDGDQPTILLIHGIFGSKEIWKPVHSYLSGYHLLIPTLPGHHEAASTPGIGELTLPNTSKHLSRLVAAKAHGGRAHVVGHSFGANIALHFTSHYPDQTLSVFVAGTAGFIRSSFTPYAMWLNGIVEYMAPRRLADYLIDADPSLRGTQQFGGVRSMALCTAAGEVLMIPIESEELIPRETKEHFKTRGVRVLVAAATKRGVLPTDDNLPRAKTVANRLGGMAVEVPTMRHFWFFQDPTLFSRVVVAWVEDGDLPDEAIRV